MGMPVAPTFDQDGYRGRTNVTDPTGVDTAFDAGDTAKDTNFTWDVDTLLRMRFVVKQTNSSATTHGDLITEFILQYNNGGVGWNDVGTVGGGTEDVDFVSASGFADGDNTGQVIGSGSNVTGDSMETNTASDSITFTDGATSETEIEVAIIINGSAVNDDDTIELRLLYSAADEAPPATAMSGTARPTITANIPPVIEQVAADITASGDITGDITRTRSLTADISGSGLLTGDVRRCIFFDADMSATGDLAANLNKTRSLTADIISSGDLTAALDPFTRLLTAGITGDGDITAALDPFTRLFTSALIGSATVTSSLEERTFVNSNITATGGVGADLTYTALVVAAVVSSGDLTADLTRTRDLTAAITGAGDLTADVNRSLKIAADILADATLTGDLKRTVAITADIAATGDVGVDINYTATITAGISATALVTANLSEITATGGPFPHYTRQANSLAGGFQGLGL